MFGYKRGSVRDKFSTKSGDHQHIINSAKIRRHFVNSKGNSVTFSEHLGTFKGIREHFGGIGGN